MGPSPGRLSRDDCCCFWSPPPRKPSPKFTVRWQSPVSVPTRLKVAAISWLRAQGAINPRYGWAALSKSVPRTNCRTQGGSPGTEQAFGRSLASGGAADYSGDAPSSPRPSEKPQVPERRPGPFLRPPRSGWAIARHAPSPEPRLPVP